MSTPFLFKCHALSTPSLVSQAASKPAQPRGHCPAAGPAGDTLSLGGEGPGEFGLPSGVSVGAWEPRGQGNSSPHGLLIVPHAFPKG